MTTSRSLPFLLIGLVEAVLRVAGVADEDPYENLHVDFIGGDRYFPQWDDEIAMPKPAGVKRVFVLGGSAVMGYRMRSFPDREGYVMAWDPSCRVVFLPLDQLAPGSFPDAPVSGIEAVGTAPVG